MTKRFGGLRAISNLSMRIEACDIYGLIGPNGSGKTTLLNTISGFYRPEEGQVLLNGEDVTGNPPHVCSKRGIARTFQSVRLFNKLTVLQNVAVSSRERNPQEHAAQILKLSGLASKSQIEADRLTLAEAKLLEISRALATKPMILLLDEPAGGLNETETEHVLSFIRNLTRMGIAVIVVEHVMRVIMALCSKIFVLSSGVLIAEGSPKEISSNPDVISSYLGSGFIS